MTRYRKAGLLVAVAVTAFAVRSFTDGRGLPRHARLSEEIADYEQKNRSLADENEALRREIAALGKDPRSLERAVREDLGFVRPDELVFTFE
jgi:cell division protein FtsB